jgi:hypothetical protein
VTDDALDTATPAQELEYQVRLRARHCCELCGVRNFALGAWTRDGMFCPAQPLGDDGMRLKWPRPGQRAWCGKTGFEHFLVVIRVVCEIVHGEHPGMPCGSADCLIYLCQRCQRALKKREAERIARAAGDLFAEAS